MEKPYEFQRDREIEAIISQKQAPKPRYSPVAVAKLKGQPIELNPKEHLDRVPAYRVYDAVLDKRVPKKKKDKTKNNMIKNQPQQPVEVLPEATSPKVHGLGTIQSTTHYHLFKQLDVNRKVDKRHVSNLVKQISKKNLLHLRPITVDADMKVIDGQHRLEAAKTLKVPIYYTKDDQLQEEDIAQLNVHQKNWGVEDYLHFFANKGVEAYKAFLEFSAEFPHYKSSILLPLVSGTGKRNPNALKQGNLDVSNIEKARTLLQQLEEIKQYTELATGTRFVEAFSMIAIHPEYDHARMINKISANPTAIVPCPNHKGYIQMLQTLYNKGVHEKNIVLFVRRF